MLIEDLFDIAWVDIVGTGEDEIFFAIDDGEEAVFIHAGEIAGMQPAIIEGLTCFHRHLPVTLHDLWATYEQFSNFFRGEVRSGSDSDEAGICTWQRDADAAEAPFAFKRIAMGGRRCLGQSISFDKPTAGERFKGFLNSASKTGCAT